MGWWAEDRTSRETGFSVTSSVYQTIIRQLTDNEIFQELMEAAFQSGRTHV